MKMVSAGWQLGLAIALLSPGLAAAAPKALQDCQNQAQKVYKKKVTEIEMASIAGNLNALEAGHARDMLQARFHRESESCRRLSSSRVL